MRGNLRAAIALLGAGIVQVAAPAAALASPAYDVPFPCGQNWQGATRDGHSPSYWSIDFNRDGDAGDLVVASAPGQVQKAANDGDSGYGKHVVVDHGGGYTTMHAHLDVMLVVVGQRLDIGDPIGLVGDTGNSYGTHLHYEQRIDGTQQPAVFGGASFAYNSEIASANCWSVPFVGDWNGDRKADVGAFRRAAGSSRFNLRMPDGQVTSIRYGRAANTPVSGDWDGNGQTDSGVWRQAGHRFRLRLPDGTTRKIKFGKLRDRPVTGDWDGDRVTDVGTWRPSSATFYLRFANGAVTTRQLGTTDDLPVSGDWDGDGRWDVGVYDRATTTFTLRRTNGSLVNINFGRSADIPVTGDWDGDGGTDVGVWRPSTARFALRYSANQVEHIRFGTAR